MPQKAIQKRQMAKAVPTLILTKGRMEERLGQKKIPKETVPQTHHLKMLRSKMGYQKVSIQIRPQNLTLPKVRKQA
jgi:hypothetical protein